jgi:hypothetical protein
MSSHRRRRCYLYTISVISICRRLQSDCQCHIDGIPEASIFITQALDNMFSKLLRLAIRGCVNSVFEFSRVSFLYTPQVGRIRTFLFKTPVLIAHCEAVGSSRFIACACEAIIDSLQLPVAYTIHKRVPAEISQHGKFWIFFHALPYAAREVVILATSACLLIKRSFEFHLEPTGEVDEGGQEDKMKLHIWICESR